MLQLVMIINLLTIAASYPLEIILKNPEYTTECEKDLRSGIDGFVIFATFGANVTANHEDLFKYTISIQILKSTSTKFEDICTVLLGRRGSACGYSATRTCNCDFIDANGAAHVRYNTSALLVHSAGIVRGEWQHNNGTYFHSKNLTLPHVYDVKKAKVALKVNNDPVVNLSNACIITFTSAQDNTLELCCTDTASPCYPILSFSDGVVVQNQTKCVKRTFTSVGEDFTGNVTVSYSVCTVDDVITKGYCLINTKSPDWSTSAILGIVLGVLVISGATAAAVMFQKERAKEYKRATSEGSPNVDSQEQTEQVT